VLTLRALFSDNGAKFSGFFRRGAGHPLVFTDVAHDCF
jgi:hypothetical protein